MGTGASVGVSGPGGRWGTGSVPASASLYSMASGSSFISGVSSVSSATSSSTNSTGSTGSTLGKPTRVRQPTGVTLRRSQTQSMKLRIQEYQDPIQHVTEEDEVMRENRERRLPPIKEFQRDYRAGKASTRIRCAQKIVTQLETTPSTRGTSDVATSGTSSTSSSAMHGGTTTGGRSTSKRPPAQPKMSVVQEIQKLKKEKEREKEKEKEREKAEKARQKEEEKAEKNRQKEAKKLAKEEKKRAKKEAKARRKEAEEALLRDDK